MLLTKEVEVAINARNKKRYLGKGYNIPTHIINGKEYVPKGTTIIVKVDDLSKGSHYKVMVQCDYCGAVFEREYCYYYATHNKQTIKNDCCAKCVPLKAKESIKEKYDVSNIWEIAEVKEKYQNTLQERYGVTSLSKIPGLYDKVKKTNLERYGTTCSLQNKEISDKVKQTNLERYGTEYSIQSQFVKDKIKNTLEERYGVDHVAKIPHVLEKRKQTNMQKYGIIYPSQNALVREKTKNTCIEKYGYDTPMKSPEIRDKIKNTLLEKYGVSCSFDIPGVREKIRKSLYENGKQKSSFQQRYINNLFDGELNYFLGYYFLDSYIEKDKIDIEFDGSGHNLSVIHGTDTEENFKEKEIIRNKYIFSHGIRMIRIISPHDKLPSDEKLKQMYLESLNYFNSSGHNWRTYYLEEGMYRDADHQEKTAYNFGTLKNTRGLYKKSKST